ncbi:MAG: signal peptidase II [Magnetococcales bacterium]|nr:signal peptidase II [Magnetococcales bacterium]
MSGSLPIGMTIAAVVVLLDQLTKWLALTRLMDDIIVILPNYFDLVLVHNVGAAFGLFTSWPPLFRDLFLATVAVFAVAFIIRMLMEGPRLWVVWGYGLVLGGALGNLWDRFQLGSVVDFIHLHWHDLSWPVFNIADSAITVGVGMLLWDAFVNEKAPSKREAL